MDLPLNVVEKFRRPLYFVKDLKAGDVITADAVRSVRPGFGVAPKFIDVVLGRILKTDVKQSTPVKWEQIDNETSRY